MLKNEIINPKYFKDRNAWRRWLAKNFDKANYIWLLFYKVKAKKKSMRYHEAVEEALCFGWIDGILKRIDDEKHMQRFTPRKPRSIWSKLNKERASRMIKLGKMTDAGWIKIKEAKKNGWWNKAYSFQVDNKMSADMKKALMSDKTAWLNFKNFPKGAQNTYIFWVNYAKRGETKQKRIKFVLQRSRKNLKPAIM